MKNSDQIPFWIQELRTNPSENVMFNLIDAGQEALPSLVSAWHNEVDPSVRIRFFEVLSEIPNKEIASLFEQKLSSSDHDEVRLAVLGLFRLDAIGYETQILRTIKSQPTLSEDSVFVKYIQNGLSSAKRRQ